MNRLMNCKMYKLLSIIGFLEFILIPAYLTHIYMIEHVPLRPYGTVFVSVCLSIVLYPLNLILIGILFTEKKFRKNIPEINRTKLTNAGFYIYIFNTIVIFLWFLFSIYLILR